MLVGTILYSLCITCRDPCTCGISFRRNRTLPEDGEEARLVKIRAAQLTLIDGELYKKGHSMPLLKCLGPDRATYALE